MTHPPVPPLTVNPLALSAEHHFLRVLNGSEPTTRAEAVRRVLRRFPGYTRLGTPERVTQSAADSWERLVKEATDGFPWVRYVERGQQRGFVLTGAGEVRLATLYKNQILTPYLRSLEASHGREVASAVAATFIERV